jgi:hypothetical protein
VYYFKVVIFRGPKKATLQYDTILLFADREDQRSWTTGFSGSVAGMNSHAKMTGAAHLKTLGVEMLVMTTPTTTTHHLAMAVVVGVVAMQVEITAIKGPAGTVAGEGIWKGIWNGEHNLAAIRGPAGMVAGNGMGNGEHNLALVK